MSSESTEQKSWRLYPTEIIKIIRYYPISEEATKMTLNGTWMVYCAKINESFLRKMALLGRYVAVTDLVQKGNQQKISKNMNMSGLEYDSVEGKATNIDWLESWVTIRDC